MDLNTIRTSADMMDHFNKMDSRDLKITLAAIIDVWHNENGKSKEEAIRFTKDLLKFQKMCHEKFGFFDEEEEQE